MINIRDHIVSIIAIFFMLGIGILIGEQLAAPALVKQQAKALDSLRVQVDGAVEDGREAKHRLALMHQVVDTLRLQVVPGKLSGKRVEIIECTDYPLAANAAEAAITDAGGSVAATITISDRFVELPPIDRANLLKALTQPTAPAVTDGPGATPATDTTDQAPVEDASSADDLSPLATMLSMGTGNDPGRTAVLETLEDDRYVTVEGDVSQPCSLFVLIGGRNDDDIPPDSDVADMESTLLNDLSNAGPEITVVGCETIDAAVSSIPTYQKAGIATIDCIDLPLGEMDLPFALRGGDDKADYGLKSTASRTLPPSLEEQTPE